MILFILQNAYHSDKYHFRNSEEWSEDLIRSHTGRRLKEMFPVGINVVVVNASPLIGESAKSCFNADLSYIQEKIDRYRPAIICACGRIAQNGCRKLNLDFVSAPHPAWRALTKVQTKQIRNILKEKYAINLG